LREREGGEAVLQLRQIGRDRFAHDIRARRQHLERVFRGGLLGFLLVPGVQILERIVDLDDDGEPAAEIGRAHV
jgi:hypothetical protein